MRQISLFQNATNPVPIGEMPIKQALAAIKSGQWRREIELVRKIKAEKGEEEYREKKKKLPALTFSGRFDRRRIDDPGFIHSKIILCDIDKLNGNLPEIRKRIETDPHVAFNFISPSNNGLKPGVFFKGRLENDEDHKRCFDFVASYFRENYEVDLDPSCKDVSRLCFVSYDPELYMNQKATPFKVPMKSPKKEAPAPAIRSDYGQRALETACSKIMMSAPGEQHHIRLKMARLVGGYIAGGMTSENDALDKLERAVAASGAKDVKAAMKTVRDGLQYGMANPISLEELEKKRKHYIRSKSVTEFTTVTDVSSVAGDTDVTFVTAVTKLTEKIEKIKTENTLSRIYNRCGFSETALIEDVIKALENDETPQPLDIIEKNLFLGFCYGCYEGYILLRRCYGVVTPTEKQGSQPSSEIQQGIVTDFVTDSAGWFTTRDLYEAVGAHSPNEKAKVRVYMKRLIDTGVAERHKTVNGKFRRIDNEAPRMDFMNYEKETDSGIILPFSLHDMVEIMPGNIILVAGSANAGKTAFLLNIARLNVKKFNVRYLNSEMGVGELKTRLEKFDDVPLKFWADNGFDPRDRPQGNFQDAIKPGEGNINIIDFLEVHEEFYAVGGMIRAIYEKLNGAIAVIALQKDRGTDLGRGGMFTIEKPRLAVALDYDPYQRFGTCKIVKAKNWRGEINPNGMSCDFNTINGAKLVQRNGWKR